MRQLAAIWFAAGMAVAAAVGYFFDSRQGGARRHMAYDKAMAGGRDLQRWSARKARHLRNKTAGTMAEIQGATESVESERTGGGQL